jgi:wyosine [tRNA(Phe)-imidazoG37] synthetase (radical SAM superfamily)
MLRVFERLSGEGQQIDHITFAGNGEPTLHPSFGEIIELTRHFRDRYYPKAKIAVLSDAATLANQQVMKSLKEVDKPILKLDAGTDNTFQEIDRPENKISLDDITDLLKSFHGGLYIQTLFLRGVVNGKLIDNTTRFEIRKWVDRLKQIRPELVMIYGIDREPPYSTLEKVTSAKLRKIAEEVKSVGMDADWY